jgi:WD40 repeat protein
VTSCVRLSRFLALVPVLVLAACATPQIQLDAGDAAMEVRHKVPAVGSVDFSPDGRTMAFGAFDGTVRVWDLNEARQIFRSAKRPGWVDDVVYLADGRSIAVSNEELTLSSVANAAQTTIWDLKSGTAIRAFPGRLSSVTRDGKLALGRPPAASHVLIVQDVEQGNALRKLEGSVGAISADGKLLVLCGTEDVGSILVPKFVSFVAVEDVVTSRRLWKEAAACTAAAFAPDGSLLLVATHASKRMGTSAAVSFVVFDAKNGKRLREFGQADVGGMMNNILGAVRSLAFSPDGRFFVSGNLEANYRIWDFEAGTVARELKAGAETHGTMPNALPAARFSPNGKTVLVSGLGSTRLFDAATGSQLATFIGFENGEWLVTTPSGYYNSSEKGDQYLHVTVGGKAYTIGQAREAFFRPDLVKAALAGRTLHQLRRIADIKPPPAVAIVDTPASVSSDEVVVTLNITDQGGGFGDVRLYRNGSAVLLEKSGAAQAGESSRTLRYTVRLETGANEIRAVAFNADNSMQSNEATVTVTASIEARRPSLYAIVVGIQDFKNPKLKLSYPVADATLFAETLRRQGAALFQRVDVSLFTSPEETTRERLVQALRGLKDKVKPEDLFVFFVASHGTTDEGEYFLITSNVGALSTERLKADALTQADLKELLANVPASKKLIVIDTCNAGALGDALQVAFLTRGMTDATAMKILSRAVGSTVLSASTSTQEALEGYKGHGLFTWVITEGLAGRADSDKDGFVSTLELATYVDNRVPALAEEIFRQAQYPVVSPSGQGFPLVKVQ